MPISGNKKVELRFKNGCFLVLLLRRAVAVELEITKELNRLLYTVESMYLSIVRELAEYAVKHNVTSATQLHKLFYSKYRSEYPSLNSQLIIQAIRQVAQIAKSFVERRRKGLAYKPHPEVRRVSIRFVETTWSYEEFVKSVARLGLPYHPSAPVRGVKTGDSKSG
jgi:hypothetical protein